MEIDILSEHKDQIYNSIDKTGRRKEFNIYRQGQHLHVHHIETDLYFVFMRSTKSLKAYKYSCFNFPSNTEYTSTEEINIKSVIGAFHDWMTQNVDFYLREKNYVEPWLTSDGQDAKDIFDETNFTAQETNYLISGLDNFSTILEQKLDVTTSQLEEIKKQINDLKEESKTEKKSKWRRNALGFIVKLMIDFAMSDEKRGELWNLFINAMNGIISIQPPSI